MARHCAALVVLIALADSPIVLANITVPAGPIEDEEVIVVWNAQTHTEHLIFREWLGPQQGAGDITVVVPTPSTPKVTLVDDAVFERLVDAANADIRANRTLVVYSLVYSFIDHSFTFARSPVRFVPKLESGHVAAPASPLASAFEPTSDTVTELADWLTPYQRDGWKLTAVRYLQPAESVRTPAPYVNHTTPEHTREVNELNRAARMTTRATRLTFTTDRPLVPMRSVPNQASRSAPFRVFFIADERFVPLQEVDRFHSGEWVSFAKSRTDLPGLLAGAVAASELPVKPWLSIFSGPRADFEPMGSRPVEDLRFAPAQPGAGDGYFPPNPIEIPLELIAFAVLLTWVSPAS